MSIEEITTELTITTTTSHRDEVVTKSIDALHDLAMELSKTIDREVRNVHVVEARSKIIQLDRALEALGKAQYLYQSLSLGEKPNGTEV